VPVPFAEPAEPLPANVVTTPADVIFLISELPYLQHTDCRCRHTATPEGLLNEAAVPVPSAEPEEPLPANVLTSGGISRVVGNRHGGGNIILSAKTYN
jgi:hypothetical protein